MCGIWAYVLPNGQAMDDADVSVTDRYLTEVQRKKLLSTVAKRGPDRSKEFLSSGKNFHLAFHRLAIHDLSPSGDQPFTITDKDGNTYYVICNGEIYNYKEIGNKYNMQLQSDSDCEVIVHLCNMYWDTPEVILQDLEGEFAFVAVRETSQGIISILAARDPYGVRPLYYSPHTNGSILFSSLLSGIMDAEYLDSTLKGSHFPPGHYYTSDMTPSDTLLFTQYYKLAINRNSAPSVEDDRSIVLQFDEYYDNITETLIEAVKTRLASDREIGFFLSGGLDSSLVVGIATRILGLGATEGTKPARTFSIGMEGSPDLAYAKQVAEFLGTNHTEVRFTAEDAISVIPEVVKCLETYDITTIRASIGSYLLAKYIRENTDVRVIMNGDGSDEVACGYIYNYYAPSPAEAHADAERLLEEIHMYDGLRVDRTVSHHGLEARLPFLDPHYVKAYFEVPEELRVPMKGCRIEKHLLRQAFALGYPNVLPNDVLFRPKEAFSNGVSAAKGKSMIAAIQECAESIGVTEADLYKNIFEELFPNHLHVIPRYWMPRWCEATDPSATTLDIYAEVTTKKEPRTSTNRVSTNLIPNTKNSMVDESPTINPIQTQTLKDSVDSVDRVDTPRPIADNVACAERTSWFCRICQWFNS